MTRAAISVMALVRALRAEALKALGLRGVWLGSALAVVIPVGLEAMNTRGMVAELESGPSHLNDMLPDMGFMDLIYGAVGIIVLATAVVASEYTAGAQTVGSARQVSTTMLVQPRRGTVVAAKVVVVLGLTVVLTAVASALTFQVTQHALGAWSPSFSPVPWGRLAGLLTWWALTALGAMALAALTRGALVPLVWGITTSSLVSPSFLLSKVTDLAAYLPDAAAWNLFMKDTSLLAAGPGTGAAALTCAAWAVLALVVTSVCWVRRDA